MYAPQLNFCLYFDTILSIKRCASFVLFGDTLGKLTQSIVFPFCITHLNTFSILEHGTDGLDAFVRHSKNISGPE